MNLFDSVKREGGRITFEAERLLKMTRLRTAIIAARAQIGSLATQIGQRAIELHSEGRLIQPELAKMCEDVRTLERQIVEKEAEIMQLRNEMPPAARPGEEQDEPELAGGRYCPSCKADRPVSSRFCSVCGTRTVEKPAGQRVCSNCSGIIPVGAVFCPTCGARSDS